MQHGKSTALRPDIQALRAIAVMGVVMNHTHIDGRPQLFRGGYAGVDVFFVISGFLITSHLVNHPPRNLGDLSAFWARRIRRLLPAALTVLLATLLMSWVFAPPTGRANTAHMGSAAATYWVNWLLAHDATDYFASTNIATPVQHYWSLSVEEQFYLVCPVLLLATYWGYRWLTKNKNRDRPGVAGMLGVLAVIWSASLVASIQLTHTDPSAAYFVTWTRIWELGSGAILAVVVSRSTSAPGRPVARKVVAWIGLAAITLSFVSYDNHTPFPGYAALLPVLGTVLVIAAQPAPDNSALGTVMAWKPFQWFGDISFSLYLWHWPIWLLLPPVFARLDLKVPTGSTQKLLVIAMSVVAAAGCKYFIEDPARYWRPTLKLWKLVPITLVAMAVVVGVAELQLAVLRHRFEAAHDRLLVRQSDPCLGAAMDQTRCPPDSYDDLVLSPTEAAHDIMDGSCQAVAPTFKLLTCIKGDPNGESIAIIGNSHMDQWSIAFDAIGTTHHLKVITHVVSGCVLGIPEFFEPSQNRPGCTRWQADVIAALESEKPRVVIVSNRQAAPTEGGGDDLPADTAVASAVTVLRQIEDLGIPVIVLKDPPYPNQAVPQCVESRAPNLGACTATIRQDYFATAAEQLRSSRIKVIALDDHFECKGTSCATVIGDVIAYQDASHLTATMVKSLIPYLDQALFSTGLLPLQ